MPRYEIVKQRYDLWYVLEEGRVIYKFSSLDQAKRKIEQLEYVDFLRNSLNPY